MKNFVRSGNVLNLAPGADVAAGVGYLFGTSLFGIAAEDVKNGEFGAFVTEGEVEIAKTSALVIAVGDRLFWDATNKVVNKTTTAQQCVGIATSAAANPSSTVMMKIGCYTAVAA